MTLRPWHKLVTPQEDLREGKPFDASVFAVHLEHVRRKEAPEDYINPERFFQRTYLTQNLLDLSSQAVRRLNGIITETSPIFNLATQFGGGKTHALTLLYHLAQSGNKARAFTGTSTILSKAQVHEVPEAKTAIFVGTEFDCFPGRGGNGEPLRRTPWGEIAWQVGGFQGYEVMRSYDEQFIAPAGDTLSKLFHPDQPYLLLFDELLNFVSRYRNQHNLDSQFYSFMHVLSEFVRSRRNIVLAVSLPKSELETSPEDIEDRQRFEKMLDRLGKTMLLSEGTETNEIIRRRLFEPVNLEEKEILKTINSHLGWYQDHKSQLAPWFSLDTAKETMLAAYPFHPAVLSVFERKWQTLPQFQQTRGVLRLLALWVSKAYHGGYLGNVDPLITLGSAPLEDSIFREAVFDQLGERRLEAAVTTDIAGKQDSHAVRMDFEAIEEVKKTGLHKKVSTIILFESNGGQSKEGLASLPEIKLSVGEPGLDIGLVDGVLQRLLDEGYYLTPVGSKYKLSHKETMNKRFADRKATIDIKDIQELVEEEVRKVFDKKNGIEKIIFPEKTNQVTDRPALQLVVLNPARKLKFPETHSFVSDFMFNYGQQSRVFKSGLIFAVAEDDQALKEEARKHLAWKSIADEAFDLNFDQEQKGRIAFELDRAKKNLAENVWKAYNTLMYLDKDNKIYVKDLGLLNSSQSKSISELYLNRLLADGELTQSVGAGFLVRHWAPAHKEWSTQQVRDAFYQSPRLPRLLKQEAIKECIANGVSSGTLAYVGKRGERYEPFKFSCPFSAYDVEISEDVFVIKAEEAQAYLSAQSQPKQVVPEQPNAPNTGGKPLTVPQPQTPSVLNEPEQTPTKPSGVKQLSWSGLISFRLWTAFYSKVLLRLTHLPNLKISIQFEVGDDDGIPSSTVEEVQMGLREMGLGGTVEFIESEKM